MRKLGFVNSFKTALVVVPLLASCGGTVNSSPVVVVDPNGLLLPDCQEGQLIGVNPDKTLTCVSALTGMLAPPNCTPGTQALTNLKDSVTGQSVLNCINKGTGTSDVTTTTRINNASTNVAKLQMDVTMLTTGGGNRGKYIGGTTVTPNGKVISGNLQGLRATTALCDAQYTGSHMCTPFEIYESIVSGITGTGANRVGIDQTSVITDQMVYMEAWMPPTDSSGSEPFAGISESCGGETYLTGDRKWTNTLFSFTAPTGSTVKVAKFNARVTCGTAAKIACCK